MEKNWQVKAIEIGGKKRLAIQFPYRKDWVAEIQQWPGAVWNRHLKCWHVQDNVYFREKLGLTAVPAAYEMNILNSLPADTGDHIRQFLRFMRSKNYSEQTIKTYTEAIGCFLKYFPDRKTAEITNADVIDFNNDYILAKNHSRSYQNQIVNALKLFYGNILQKEIDIDKIHRPRKIKTLPNVLSKEDVKRILEGLQNLKHRAMLSLIYSCGLRSAELLHLQPGDIDSKRNLLFIKQAKGFKDRVAPLSNKTIRLLREYYLAYKPKTYLFEGQYPGTPYDSRSLQQVMKKAVEKAGIPKSATLHWLRHSYATHLLESGIDLRYIQEILGHSSSKTTEIYTHVSTRNIQHITSPFDDL
jgi:integrase/recombinase XerD